METTLKKLLNFILRAILVLIVISIFGMGALYWFLQRNPQEMASRYMADFSRQTGLDFSFNSVEVTLLPLPAITLTDLVIKNDTLRFRSAWVCLRPTLGNLFHLDLMPGEITLARPKIIINTQAPLTNPEQLKTEIFKEFAINSRQNVHNSQISLPHACQLRVTQGQLVINGADETLLAIGNFETDFELISSGDVVGKTGFSYLRLNHKDKRLFALENIDVSGACNIFDFMNDAHDVRMTGIVMAGNWLKPTNFNFGFDGSSSGWLTATKIDGALALDGVAVPLHLAGRFMGMENSSDIIMRGLEWSLDMDSGRLDATFTLPQGKLGWQLGGTLFVHRASLTQWLGFARNLAPGLQLALDNILEAKLNFNLNAQGLHVPQIEATCTGARFTGSGGVKNFAAPVVFLDLKSEKANLGLAIPESIAKSPMPVTFPYPPLTPLPGEPLKPGETGISYDINLAAKKLLYGPLTIQNASLRIHPGKMDKNGLEDVLLDGKGNFYGGTVNGKCILGADKSMPINIAVNAHNINGAGVATDMRILPFRKGRFNASANVFSKGKKLDTFLANLNGPVNIRGSSVTLAAKDAPVFSRLDVNATLRGASEDRTGVIFNALWKVDAEMRELETAMSLDGKLHFGKSGMTIKSVPAKFTFNIREDFGPIPQKTKISASCSLSGNSDEGKYSLGSMTASFAGVSIKTNMNIDTNKSSFQGKMSLDIPNLATPCKTFGAPVSIPQNLRRMKMDANLNGHTNEIKLTGIKGSIGDSGLSGHFSFIKKTKPNFDFAITINRFDWEKQIGKTSRSAPDSKKWNFKFLSSFDAKGSMAINDFRGWGVNLTSIKAPLALASGNLSVGPVTANYCGAPIQCRAHADFNSGLSFNAVIAAHGFNLEQAARDRKIESALSGKASLDASVNANLTGPGQMPGRLNGDWSFNVLNGSWQARNSKGQLTGSPTKFASVTASGKIHSGVVQSGNFQMRNQGMQIGGKGNINLVSGKIDCNLNVNMKNLPNFPVHVYGNLDNPKTSIGAGKMVINAIGGIATGLGNMVGGLVRGAWDIFR